MHWVDGVIPVLQVKYKEGFGKHLKGQRPHYNPLECLSFKHIQAAAALASQVRDPVLFCPISPPIPPSQKVVWSCHSNFETNKESCVNGSS